MPRRGPSTAPEGPARSRHSDAPYAGATKRNHDLVHCWRCAKSKSTIKKIFVGGLVALAAGLVLPVAAGGMAYASGTFIMAGSDVVGVRSTPGGAALILLAVVDFGFVAMVIYLIAGPGDPQPRPVPPIPAQPPTSATLPSTDRRQQPTAPSVPSNA
jgi:hypothetical protein